MTSVGKLNLTDQNHTIGVAGNRLVADNRGLSQPHDIMNTPKPSLARHNARRSSLQCCGRCAGDRFAAINDTIIYTVALAVIGVMGMLTPSLSVAQSSAATERLQNAGVATVSELEALSRRHAQELERVNKLAEDAVSSLEYRIEALERRLSRIEKARELEERRAEEASFEKSRMLNWPKAASGMNRREIYRLIGSGVKDRTETSRDCRCYSQGKICFSDEDLAEKSNVRCQL